MLEIERYEAVAPRPSTRRQVMCSMEDGTVPAPAYTCLWDSLETCYHDLVQHAASAQRCTEAEAIALCARVPCYVGALCIRSLRSACIVR